MIAHRQAGRVRLAPGIAVGVLGVAGAYAGTRLSTSIRPGLLLRLFAGLMLVAAAAMLRRRRGAAGQHVPAAESPHGSDAAAVPDDHRVSSSEEGSPPRSWIRPAAAVQAPGRPMAWHPSWRDCGRPPGSQDRRRGHGGRPAHRLFRRGQRVRHRPRAGAGPRLRDACRGGDLVAGHRDQQRRRAATCTWPGRCSACSPSPRWPGRWLATASPPGWTRPGPPPPSPSCSSPWPTTRSHVACPGWCHPRHRGDGRFGRGPGPLAASADRRLGEDTNRWCFSAAAPSGRWPPTPAPGAHRMVGLRRRRTFGSMRGGGCHAGMGPASEGDVAMIAADRRQRSAFAVIEEQSDV